MLYIDVNSLSLHEPACHYFFGRCKPAEAEPDGQSAQRKCTNDDLHIALLSF